MLFTLVLPALAAPEMRIHLIDVGQGAATLVEFPCGAMLVDTGGEQAKDMSYDSVPKLTSYLDAFFARRTDLTQLDLLLLTHPHIDHVRAVPALLGKPYRPRNVVDNGDDGAWPADDEMKALRAYVAANTGKVGYRPVSTAAFPASGKGIKDAVIDPFKKCQGIDPSVKALWGGVPTDPGWLADDFGDLPFDDQNNHSVVTRVDFGKASYLVLGDLEIPAIQSMLRARAPSEIDADVLQVSHHGSHTGRSLDLLKAVTPEWALIGVGPDGRSGVKTAIDYGHPRMGVIDDLLKVVSGSREARSVQAYVTRTKRATVRVDKAIYATGWDGSVVLVADAEGHFKRGTPDWPPPPVAGAVHDSVPVAPTGPTLEVTFADVGEGDSILVKLGDTEMLVDSGRTSSDRYLAGMLSQIQGPLEYFVLSHPHIDHYGGATTVLGSASVRHMVTNGERRGDPPDTKRSPTWDEFEETVAANGLKLEAAKEGTTLIDTNGLKVTVLWSGGHFNERARGDDINNDSVVLLVEYGGKRLLLTGDVEVKAGEALVAKYCPHGPATCPALDVDVLKVPHHGSADFDTDFYTATRPTWAVVSAGYHLEDSHRLPRADSLDALQSLGVKVLSTSADGEEPVRLRVSPAGDISWDMPSKPAFFWRKLDGEYLGVEVPQGE
jgi:competence protein ComEC